MKKGRKSIDDNATTFPEKMMLFSYLVPIQLTKIEKFANALPSHFGPIVKMASILKATVRATKNGETQLKERGLERTEVGEKRKFDRSSRSNKKSKSSKSGSKGGGGEAKWCENCKKKHHGKCDGEVTCFKCRKPGHYAN